MTPKRTEQSREAREERKATEERLYRERLQREARAPRDIDVAGLVKAAQLMDQRDEG